MNLRHVPRWQRQPCVYQLSLQRVMLADCQTGRFEGMRTRDENGLSCPPTGDGIS